MADRSPIFDNHIHLRPEGRGIDAARDFERAGGTALLLTHSPYADIPIRHGSDYESAYGKTLAMAEAVRRATSLQVFVALGPYPVELWRLSEVDEIGYVEDIGRQGVDLASRHIGEGRAVAFGEVGRPHFPVAEAVLQACNNVVSYVLEEAKRLDCAVVLHTEDPTPRTFEEYARMAERRGFDKGHLVKHHSTPLTRPEDNHGLVPSLRAKEDLVAEALRGGPRFLLETDFIDDPRRPGAVLGPMTVPRKTKAWLGTGLLTMDQAQMIHEELPQRTYGIELG